MSPPNCMKYLINFSYITETNVCYNYIKKLDVKENYMNHYIAFIKIVELGSFTKAAEHLGYTQSGISMLMKSLEEEVRTKLIIRSRSGITLSPDGQQLYSAIKNIVQSKHALDDAVSRLEGLEKAHIRIGVLISVVHHFLANWMTQYKQMYPTVTFELVLGDYSDIENMIKEGTVDFGFVNPEITEGLTLLPCISDEYVVCIPVQHPLALKQTIAIHNLNEEPYILIKDGNINPIQQYIVEEGVQLNIIATVSDDRIAIELIKNNFGISIMPSLIVPANEQQIVVKSLSVPKQRLIHIGYKDFDILPLATRNFIRYIQAQL